MAQQQTHPKDDDQTAKDSAAKATTTRKGKTVEEEATVVEPVAAMPMGGDIYPKYDENGNLVEPNKGDDEGDSRKS